MKFNFKLDLEFYLVISYVAYRKRRRVNAGILEQKERHPAVFPSLWIIIIIIFIFFIFSSPSFALEAGTISGTVVDPSGAVVASATVMLRNSKTGTQQNSSSDAEGVYSFSNLPAGQYEIEIFASGFKPYRQSGVNLGSAAIKVDVQLELKSEATTVEVSADTIQIDISTTQMGEAIAATKMSAVPLNGRSFTDLMAIQPGVVPASSQQPNAVIMNDVTSTSPSGDLNAGNTPISGQRETTNGFRVNGSDVEEDVNMGTAIVPNLDSIQELRVLTNSFDAEYGNYSVGRFSSLPKLATISFMETYSSFFAIPILTHGTISPPNARSSSRISLAEPSADLSLKIERSSLPTIKALASPRASTQEEFQFLPSKTAAGIFPIWQAR